MTLAPGNPSRGSTTGRPVMVLFDILGQRWTLRILWELREGPLTFRDLQARCGDISPSLLNTRLKSLRALGLVTHQEGEGYGYTPLGEDLTKQLALFDRWAEKWAAELELAKKREKG
ncbi:MAG: transcriptional regulator [Alphaproteobacteria bacterium]|nr:MAG: transcriptional regulator [Alphaproteobacteria bacterium]